MCTIPNGTPLLFRPNHATRKVGISTRTLVDKSTTDCHWVEHALSAIQHPSYSEQATKGKTWDLPRKTWYKIRTATGSRTRHLPSNTPLLQTKPCQDERGDFPEKLGKKSKTDCHRICHPTPLRFRSNQTPPLGIFLRFHGIWGIFGRSWEIGFEIQIKHFQTHPSSHARAFGGVFQKSILQDPPGNLGQKVTTAPKTIPFPQSDPWYDPTNGLTWFKPGPLLFRKNPSSPHQPQFSPRQNQTTFICLSHGFGSPP